MHLLLRKESLHPAGNIVLRVQYILVATVHHTPFASFIQHDESVLNLE